MKSQAPLVKLSRWRKFFGWFGRHKALAVFAVLMLAVVLFFVGSDVVYRFQVYFEHKRFDNASMEVAQLGRLFKDTPADSVKYKKECTHSNFGGIFEVDTISCDSGVTVIYRSVQKHDVPEFLQRSKEILSKKGITLVGNPHNDDPSNVGSYSFNAQRLDCSFDNDYYPSDGKYYLGAYHEGMTFSIDIDCGGRALQDYFPVVKD